jgi:hypothetical protein
MAKAPSSVSGWAGDGNVWFKVWFTPSLRDVTQQDHRFTRSELRSPMGPFLGLQTTRRPFRVSTFTTKRPASSNLLPVPIPKSLPSGQYLLRIEHIGLHGAASSGGAQFYIAYVLKVYTYLLLTLVRRSCAQVNVSGGGSGSPSPLVSFPGAYKATVRHLSLRTVCPPLSHTHAGPGHPLPTLLARSYELCRPWTGAPATDYLTATDESASRRSGAAEKSRIATFLKMFPSQGSGSSSWLQIV